MRLTRHVSVAPWGTSLMLELTGAPTRLRVTARRRSWQHWCVGVSWFGVQAVRSAALHLGVVTLTLAWDSRRPTFRAAEPLRDGDIVSIAADGLRKARG